MDNRETLQEELEHLMWHVKTHCLSFLEMRTNQLASATDDKERVRLQKSINNFIKMNKKTDREIKNIQNRLAKMG